MDFFVTAARGLAPLVEAELREFGATATELREGGVAAQGELELGYRCCLWSRVASRVLLVLHRFPLVNGDGLYVGAREIAWREQLRPQDTLAVDCVGNHPAFNNTTYAALKVKDAIVDQLREQFGQRPSVDKQQPSLRINLHLEPQQAQLAVDLSGDGLHRRGYRLPRASAPLRENLAAGLLLLADWPRFAQEGRPLVDPMCGSGTLLIEAALIAADVAPGLLRDGHGFDRWLGHDPKIWQRLLSEARTRDRRRQPPTIHIYGSDIDSHAVAATTRSSARCGLSAWINCQQLNMTDCRPPAGPPGLIVVNPPYGERLGEVAALKPLYLELGETLKQHFGGYTAQLLSANPELSTSLGLKTTRKQPLWNGPIECRLLCYPITATPAVAPRAATSDAQRFKRLLRDPQAEMFANRLRKNAKQLARWARREEVHCYRVYDADIPQYAAAIDRYEDRVLVQEYAAPVEIEPAVAEARLHDMLLLSAEVLEVSPQAVYLKVRERQRGAAQYRKQGSSAELFVVREGSHRFYVNLRDYLDTGLFLDHRLTRQLIGELSQGRAMLNLFCYTGTATVYAARGGAISTRSVDLSATYLDWARRNLELNGFQPGKQHLFEQQDCISWLAQHRGRYGLIFLDPPTFSNSKKMQGTLDIQRDQGTLLAATTKLLDKQGILIFSTNSRRFVLDASSLSGLAVEEISPRLLPNDFARNPRIHRVYRITRE